MHDESTLGAALLFTEVTDIRGRLARNLRWPGEDFLHIAEVRFQMLLQGTSVVKSLFTVSATICFRHVRGQFLFLHFVSTTQIFLINLRRKMTSDTCSEMIG